MNVRSWYRQLGLGSLLLRFYHRPVGHLRSVISQGGPLAIRETERQRVEMERAAATLPPLPTPSPDTPLCLQMLTGRRFWYQTAFCLHSFVRAAGEPVRVEIHDDGTLEGESAALLERLGPAVHIHPQGEAIARLDQHLPANRYPVLRELWKSFFLIRKLTDIHVGRQGWKLFIDSDLLFFRKPALLLDWLRAPDRPLHALDCMEAYGYSRPLLERLAGGPIPDLINTGLCGLRSDEIDWDQMEAWCAEMIAQERRHYYMEQALVALLSSRYPKRTFAPAEDYVTLPPRGEVTRPQAVMHHYVANSKRWYFRDGWRHVVGTR